MAIAARDGAPGRTWTPDAPSGGLPLVDGRPHRVLVLVPGGVEGRVLGPFGGHRVLGVDRVHGALGLAGATVDALVGVDGQHPVGALVEMDAVDGTHRDARLVQDVDARLGDDVGHGSPPGSGPVVCDGTGEVDGRGGPRARGHLIAQPPRIVRAWRGPSTRRVPTGSTRRQLRAQLDLTHHPLLDVAGQVAHQQQLAARGDHLVHGRPLARAEPDPQPTRAGRHARGWRASRTRPVAWPPHRAAAQAAWTAASPSTSS